MQIARRTASCFAAMIAIPVIVAACAEGVYAKPIPVEIWRTGDDGLTLKFSDAVDAAFRNSPNFILSSGSKPGTLMVIIPTNVPWKQIGHRTQVLYTVEFAMASSQNIGMSTGACWDDTLPECAKHILKDAKIAVRKLH